MTPVSKNRPVHTCPQHDSEIRPRRWGGRGLADEEDAATFGELCPGSAESPMNPAIP